MLLNRKLELLLYGLLMAFLIMLLKLLEYRFVIRELSATYYIGAVAVLFTAIGIWAGRRLTGRKKNGSGAAARVDSPNLEEILQAKGISRREYEVLTLMASGHSNQEIADKLFISLNTVKTHSSNLFLKLEAKRRTQAIAQAKVLGLIS
jgi:two-component system, NarL family, response regulator LiaR